MHNHWAKYATPLATTTCKISIDKNLSRKNGKGVDLPPIFKCRICDKNKSANDANFSKNELKTYVNRVQNGQVLTPFSAKLRCRACSSDPKHELQCQHCTVIKSKDDFSLNQRTRPEVAWCKACVNWQEMNEPGTEMLPGPSMGLAPSGNEDFEYENCEIQPELNGHQVDLEDERLAWGTIQTDNTTATNPNVVPITASATVSASILSTEVHVGHVGQHVLPTREIDNDCDDDGSGSSASNPYESGAGSLAMTNAFSQLDPFQGKGGKAPSTRNGGDDFMPVSSKKKKPAKDSATYIAYDADGVAHTKVRDDSTSYATSGVAASTSGSLAYTPPRLVAGNVRSQYVDTRAFNTRDWARVPSGKTPATPARLLDRRPPRAAPELDFDNYVPEYTASAASVVGADYDDDYDSFDEA